MGSVRLSQDAIEMIKKMASYETKIDDIALAIGTDAESVRFYIYQLDLPYFPKPLTDSEKEKIRELSDGRRSYLEIAKLVGRKHQTIVNYVLKNDLPRMTSGARKGDKNGRAKYGMTAEQKQRVLELYETGMTLNAIAQAVERTHTSVEKYLHKQGLNQRNPGPPDGRPNPYKYRDKIIPKDHYLYGKQKTLAESRYVMEKELGRPLDSKEVVHHIDRNRRNNDPKNLIVFASQLEHMRHHAQERIDQQKRLNQLKDSTDQPDDTDHQNT